MTADHISGGLYLTAAAFFVMSIVATATSPASRRGVLLAELVLLLVSLGAFVLTTGAASEVGVSARVLAAVLGVPLAMMAAIMVAGEDGEPYWLSLGNALAASAAVGSLIFTGSRWAVPFALLGATMAAMNLAGVLLAEWMRKSFKKGASKS